MSQPLQSMCVECGTVRPRFMIPPKQPKSKRLILTPLLTFAFEQHFLRQLKLKESNNGNQS